MFPALCLFFRIPIKAKHGNIASCFAFLAFFIHEWSHSRHPAAHGGHTGQFVTGWHDNNDELREMGLAALSAGQYFHSGHSLEATFENWESEFLQMAPYVLLMVWLR